MKTLPTVPVEFVAVMALAVLAIGVGLVFGVGWALIVSSVLVIVYIVLPDQRPGGTP